MKKLFVFISALSTICISANAIYGAQYWAKTYGRSSWGNRANSIRQTADGGYIVAGSIYSYSFGTDNKDALVLKLNSYGTVSWQKTYGGSEDDGAYFIEQTLDKGFIVAGFTQSFGAGGTDFWVLKLDGSGDITWQKTYGGSDLDNISSIQKTSDGGYIMAGNTYSFGTGDCDAWVLKLDGSGNVSWQKTYGGSDWDEAVAILQTADGGYILAGDTSSFNNGALWVLKLDGSGNISWQKAYGDSYSWPESARSIQKTSDGGYIVVAATPGYFPEGIWIFKLDSYGDVYWQKIYLWGNVDDFKDVYSMQQTSDGGYILVGYNENWYTQGINIKILKLDSDGNISWQKGTYEGQSKAFSIHQITDGGYILAGYTSIPAYTRKNLIVMVKFLIAILLVLFMLKSLITLPL